MKTAQKQQHQLNLNQNTLHPLSNPTSNMDGGGGLRRECTGGGWPYRKKYRSRNQANTERALLNHRLLYYRYYTLITRLLITWRCFSLFFPPLLRALLTHPPHCNSSIYLSEKSRKKKSKVKKTRFRDVPQKDTTPAFASRWLDSTSTGDRLSLRLSDSTGRGGRGGGHTHTHTVFFSPTQ